MPPAVKPHAFLQEDEINSQSLLAKRIQASWHSWGMPQAGKPHWGHEARIYTHALTLPTFLMPHSSLPPWNSSRTQNQQIIEMPSTRTGQRYSTRPSMPSSPTLRQGSHVSSPSLTTSTSILTDNGNKSPTSPFLNMAESLMMTMIMTTSWLY